MFKHHLERDRHRAGQARCSRPFFPTIPESVRHSRRPVPSTSVPFISSTGSAGVSQAGTCTRGIGSGWRRRFRILVETVSTKPVLIRSVIRADRYEASIRRHVSYPSHSWVPFFGETYADDLVEYSVEHLGRDAAHPAEPIHAEFDPSRIVVTAGRRGSLLWGLANALRGVRPAGPHRQIDRQELAKPLRSAGQVVPDEQAVHLVGQERLVHSS